MDTTNLALLIMVNYGVGWLVVQQASTTLLIFFVILLLLFVASAVLDKMQGK